MQDFDKYFDDELLYLIYNSCHKFITAKHFDITILIAAARAGNLDMMRWFLKQGASIEETDDVWGRTALIWAAVNGHLDIMQLLYKHGALLQEKDHLGMTPLIHATHYGYSGIIEWLLQNGADFQPHRAELPLGADGCLSRAVRIGAGAVRLTARLGYLEQHFAADPRPNQ